MPEETTINKTNREETKEKAKKESKRAIRKREKEEARKRLLNQEQSRPVTERVITRDAYEKRKDYKEALRIQEAEIYKIEEIYKAFFLKTQENASASNENLTKSQKGDIISIQHTDDSGEKKFSPPMEIEEVQKDEDGKVVGYILKDMQGNKHTLANTEAEVVPVMSKDQAHEAFEKGKQEVEKTGPKKLQKRIVQQQMSIADNASKAAANWKETKEQATGGKVNIDIANEDIKAVVEKCPNLVLDYMQKNGINTDGLDLSGAKTKADRSAKILEYLGNQKFDKEVGDKLSEYLKDKPAREAEYSSTTISVKNITLSDEAKFACNAVPTNVQDKMKELGIISKDTKWMNSKALMDYMKEGDNLTLTQKTLDDFEEYIADKPARQRDYAAYMKKTQGRSR